MKKKSFIVGLAIGGGFGAYTFIKHSKERKHADETFFNSIKDVCDLLKLDYNTMSENEKRYYYNKVASNLYRASQIKTKTSYKKLENDDINLPSALYKLHIFMSSSNESVNNERRMEVLSERGEELIKALENLNENSKDKENWIELSKQVNKIVD